MKSVEVKAQFLLQENNQVQEQLKKKNEEMGLLEERLRKEYDTNLGSKRQFMDQESAYRLQIDKLSNQLNQMKEEMINQDSLITMLKQDQQIHENKHKDFQCKLSISQNQLSSYQQEINQVKNEWQNQEQAIQQLENERSAMEEEIQLQLQENEQLAARLQSVTELYAEAKEQLAKTENQLDQKNGAFTEQQHFNQELELQKNELSLSLQDERRSLQSLQEQVQELTSRLNKQDQYVKELLRMISSSESMTTGLSEKFTSMSLDVEKAERKEREWEQRAQRAEQKLEEEVREKEQIAKQFEQMNAQLIVEQEKATRLNKDFLYSQQESKDIRNKLQTMEANFEIQCAEFNRQLMFKETELTRRINENEKLTRINCKTENNVHSLTKRLESIKGSMRNSSKTKISEVETLKAELKNLSCQYETLRIQNNGLKQSNFILKERLPNKKQQESENNEAENKSKTTNQDKNYLELPQQNKQNFKFKSQLSPQFIVSQRLGTQQLQTQFIPQTANYNSNYQQSLNKFQQ